MVDKMKTTVYNGLNDPKVNEYMQLQVYEILEKATSLKPEMRK